MPKRLHPTTPASKPEKPEKPYPEYPLFAHAAGVWAKKIRGKLHYFGPWSDPQGALDKYLDEKDDLHAGRKPSQAREGAEVRDLVNAFLTSKERLVEAGELKPATFRWYRRGCEHIVTTFGGERLADDVRPEDFGTLRTKLAKRYGPSELGKLIQLTRSVFKFAYEAGMIATPMRFGPEFQRPSAKAMRQARHRNGGLMFTAETLRKLLDGQTVKKKHIKGAGVPLRAMILLGVNAGWGQSDIAELPMSALDLDAGVATFPRPKTAIDRRVVLWPETIKALREAIQARPKPKSKADANLAFITSHGRRWVRFVEKGEGGTWIDSIGLEFTKLLNNHGAKRKGLAFYSLRRTFRTVADEVGDRAAVDLIMGHIESGYMGTRYVQQISDDRLRAVTDHVRAWIGFGEASEGVIAKIG